MKIAIKYLLFLLFGSVKFGFAIRPAVNDPSASGDDIHPSWKFSGNSSFLDLAGISAEERKVFDHGKMKKQYCINVKKAAEDKAREEYERLKAAEDKAKKDHAKATGDVEIANDVADGIGTFADYTANGANIAGAVTSGAHFNAATQAVEWTGKVGNTAGGVNAAATCTGATLLGVGTLIAGLQVAFKEMKKDDIIAKLDELEKDLTAKGEDPALAEKAKEWIAFLQDTKNCVIKGTKHEQVVTLGGASANLAAGCVCLAVPATWPFALVTGLAVTIYSLRDKKGTQLCTKALEQINEMVNSEAVQSELTGSMKVETEYEQVQDIDNNEEVTVLEPTGPTKIDCMTYRTTVGCMMCGSDMASNYDNICEDVIQCGLCCERQCPYG